MTNNVSFDISKDHPCLAGHFPHNPIVPGVVILDEISNIIVQEHKDCRIHSFLNVKFLQPLKSGQSVSVKLEEKVNVDNSFSKVKFSGTFNGDIIAQGEVKLEVICPEELSPEDIN